MHKFAKVGEVWYVYVTFCMAPNGLYDFRYLEALRGIGTNTVCCVFKTVQDCWEYQVKNES